MQASAPLPVSSRGSRLRALGWAVAIEAALLLMTVLAWRGANIHAFGPREALLLPLTLVQLPGWLVAAACLFPFETGAAPSVGLFNALMGVANVPFVYAGVRLSQTRRRAGVDHDAAV